MTIRVLVADDDDDFRSALADVLDADERFSVVGAAVDGDDAVEQASRTAPAVVLLDVRMPAGGPAAAARLRALPEPPVVVAVSAETGSSGIAAMLRAGATGYLAKGALGLRLPDLVARAAAGETVLEVPGGEELLQQLAAERADGPSDEPRAPDVP